MPLLSATANRATAAYGRSPLPQPSAFQRLLAGARGAKTLWGLPASLSSVVRTEARLVAVRWFGILLMLPSLALLHLPLDRLVLASGVVGLATAYTLFIQRNLARRPGLFSSGYFVTLGDALLCAAVVWLAGGFDTPLYFLLYAVTIASAMRFGYGPAATVTVCTLVLDGWDRHSVGLGLDGSFVVRSGFLVLTGLLASYLRVQTHHVEAALQGQLRQATHAALHDQLTGLANQLLLTNCMDQALHREAAGNPTVAILFIDLDRFKEVNDAFGHHYGDLLLQEVARRLGAALAPSATIARLSGDEFAVVIPGANAESAGQIAQRLLRCIEQPVQLDEIVLDVSASIGIAISPDHGHDAESLQRRAELAMHVAKARHGDYVIYAPDDYSQGRDRLELAADLRRAIERGELRLHYQPIVSLHTGKIEEAEALARWLHPRRGLVPPSQFIPLAEETGMILPIGRWVLHEACRQAVAWQTQHAAARSLVMSVNMSARQFQYADVPADVGAVLEETGLDPRWLKLEITESVAMDDPEVSIASLWLLKGMGVRLAIDDFGTGYSSLGYLKRFPADTLKIDKVFIDGLGVHPEDTAIVAATIAFAQAVGLTTTAEGVEDSHQIAQARRLGADRVQGFYCSEPLPAEQFIDLFLSDWSLGEAIKTDTSVERRPGQAPRHLHRAA